MTCPYCGCKDLIDVEADGGLEDYLICAACYCEVDRQSEHGHAYGTYPSPLEKIWTGLLWIIFLLVGALAGESLTRLF